MTGPELAGLLADAARIAERGAPSADDPVASLRQRRRRVERRRGHLAMLAFLLFLVVLQGLPSEAFGSPPAYEGVVAAGPGRGAISLPDPAVPASVLVRV